MIVEYPTNVIFHLWIPNIFEYKGGIQVYSNYVIVGLNNIYPKAEYEIFLKHDTKIQLSYKTPVKSRFHFTGKIPVFLRTFFFAVQLIAYSTLKKPDLIITTHLNFNLLANLLKWFLGIHYVTIAHGVEAWNISKPSLISSLKNADKILSVSEYTRMRLIQEQNLNPEKIGILANTFDHRRFNITQKPSYLLKKYNLNSNHKTILTVSRLPKTDGCDKGYDKIIAALPKILEKVPEVHYLLVGKGDDKPRIEQQIRNLKLDNHVTLAGFIPDEQLCDYYNLCDVFAMPSKKEGFGIVFLEALACGKPTLAGNQDGSVDALLGGELGALVNPDYVDEIADTITRILQGNYSHPLIYQPEKLRQKVIDNFGFEKFQATLAKHIEEILQ